MEGRDGGRPPGAPRAVEDGARYVYLGRPAAELLEALPRDREWIFPGAVEGKPIYDLASVWNRVRERADLPPGVRLYDVTRHGFITRAAGLGVPLEERKLLSRHAPSREAHFKYLHQTVSDGSLSNFGINVHHPFPVSLELRRSCATEIRSPNSQVALRRFLFYLQGIRAIKGESRNRP